MSATIQANVGAIGRGDRVSIPALSVGGTVAAELGGVFGDGEGVLVRSNGRKFRVTAHDGVLVERWDGWRYYDVLEGGRIERDGDGWRVEGDAVEGVFR